MAMSSDHERQGVHSCDQKVPGMLRICVPADIPMPRCKSKLGDVDTHGMAKRTVNWTAYLSAILAVLGLGIYIWWAFLR